MEILKMIFEKEINCPLYGLSSLKEEGVLLNILEAKILKVCIEGLLSVAQDSLS